MHTSGMSGLRVTAAELGLREVLATRIDAYTTGFPADADIAVAAVGAQEWSLFDDLVPPVVVLRAAALQHNTEVMSAYCRANGVDLAPHGKTSMAPQLWAQQLDAGAWGMTAATPVQARTMRAVGVPRILLADELTDAGSIRWVGRELADPGFDFACWVDSVQGVALLREGLVATGAGRPLPVLVELGHEDGRTGCRSLDEALDLAALIAETPELMLIGVAGYEGTICGDRGPECLLAVDAFLSDLRELARELLGRSAFDAAGEAIVSAGGSAFFDRVVSMMVGWPGDLPVRVVLRSGCYLTHDHGVYERNSPLSSAPEPGDRFLPAFEAWGVVLSRPEPRVVVVGLGKRDVPSDIDPPMPLGVRRSNGARAGARSLRLRRLMDQHAICDVDGDMPLDAGDLVGFGISHPCTAFDRRRVIPVVAENDRVVDAVVTFF
jgi:D-serine dehydratase